MKCPVLYGLVFCIVLSSTAFAQEFEVPITISDNTNSAVLTIGVHPNGTDGFDAGLDAFAPPPPPAGAFDVRSIIGVEAFITDIRDIATVEKIFHLQYQPASDQGSIVLTWDSTGLSMLGSFFITDDVTGDLFGPLDMTTTDRLEVSTAGGLLDDRLRVLVTPSLPQENSAPTALDDTATTDEDTVIDIDVLANDTDPDGDALVVTQVSDPPNGTAIITPGGTVRYIPEADFHGPDSFTYTLSDPGGLTAQATVTVTITSVNDAPVFTSTPVTGTAEGQLYSYTATATDIDGDPLALSAPTRPAWLSFSDQGDGTARLSGTPGSGEVGDHDVVIEASDGVVMVEQAFTITVSDQPNQDPTPQDDEAMTDEDTALDIDVLANDTDPDGDALAVTQVSDPPNGTASISPGGMVSYQPDADFNGADSFAYTVSDPGGLTAQATVTITVSSVNDAPVFTSTPVTGASEGQPYTYTAVATDIDIDPLTLSAPTRPAWLSFSDQGDGTAAFSGTPGSGEVGDHDVVIEASDGVAMMQQAFTITVSDQPNQAPTPQDDEATTDEDTALDIDVLANDTDPDGDALAVTQVSNPLRGTVSVNADGTVRYNPEANFHGNDRFTYTASDPGGLTAQGTVVVTVTPVNDVPAFTSTSVTEATPGESYSYGIATADVDDDALTLTAPALPTWLAFTDNSDGTATLEGTPSPTDAGTHDVLLEVTDGAVTVQQDFTVTVSAAMNLPPSATSPTTPLNEAMVRLEGDPGTAFIVEWNAANDPNGDVVSYRWELSLTQTFSTLLFNEDVGMAIRFETTVGAVATALTREGISVGSALKVFHRVVTSDGTNETVGPTFALTLMRGVLVGVEAESLPEQFALLGNYPNPFNPETIIRYALAEPTRVYLAVYDALGRQVAVLVDEAQQAGYHQRVFNAASLRSGTYFYQLKTKHFRQVKGMIFMK